MIQVVVPGLYAVAGIAAYAGVHQFSMGVSRPRNPTHLLLSVLCGAWAVGAVYLALALHAASADELIGYLRTNIDASIIMAVLVPWFVTSYAGMRTRGAMAVFLAASLVMIAANEALPYTLQFVRIDGTHVQELPWGETLVRISGNAGAWTVTAVVVFLSVFLFSAGVLVRHYLSARSVGSLWILGSMGLFFATAIEGILVRLRIVDFFEAGPFGFTIMMVTMGVIASRETKARLRASEANYRALFENSPQMMLAIDTQDGRIHEANQAAQSLTGYERRELVGLPLLALTRAEDKDEVRANWAGLISGKLNRMRFDRWYLCKDGSAALVDVSISTLRNGSGKVSRIIASANDISARRRAEEALRDSEERLLAVIDQSPIAIGFARDGLTLDVNKAYLQTFGYESEDELRGRPLFDQIAPQCRAEMADRIARRARGEAIESEYETIGLRRDGTQFPVYTNAKRLDFEDGPITIAFIIDITKQKSSEEEIRRLALYDHLTGLANRQLLIDRIRRTLATSTRKSTYSALLLVDMDQFKGLNDSFGHEHGDELLKQVAARLSDVVWEGDTVARLGGDEFVVLLEDLGERKTEALARAEQVGEKVMNGLCTPYSLDGREVRLSCSIGVSMYRDPRLAAEDVIKQADIAMYQAKDAGRRAIRFFDNDMQELIDRRVLLESDLHAAIEKGQFVLNYQVQVDGSCLPIGAEALIRWPHPTRGTVAPSEFIPLAEETNLIFPIGQWVLNAACAQLEKWRGNPLTRDLILSVNVSKKQFRKADFVENVRNALAHRGVDPSRLQLELTESMLFENVEDVVATMKALRAIGVRFSLDDFGTGYSSLQYLKRLPLDELKIDQSFVRDISEDPNDLAIVRTVVAMAQSLGVEVIAEGVETREQLEMLRTCGCRRFQGYLFARPVPEERLVDAIESTLVGVKGESRQVRLENLRG